MKKLNGAANRFWLAVIGLLLFAAGALWLITGLGLGRQLLPNWPSRDTAPADVVGGIGDDAQLAGIIIAVGVVLAILGLWWLIRQFPQQQAAKPLRMQENSRNGMTYVPSQVIADAAAADIEQLAGVENAHAVLRGTKTAPQLAARIDIEERADFAEIFEQLRTSITEHCAHALGTELERFDVEVRVVRAKKRARSVRVA